jgi:hypothetical protein
VTVTISGAGAFGEAKLINWVMRSNRIRKNTNEVYSGALGRWGRQAVELLKHGFIKIVAVDLSLEEVEQTHIQRLGEER